jgi:CRISPR/Cas system CSM-associated protein Csm2 small subunit
LSFLLTTFNSIFGGIAMRFTAEERGRIDIEESINKAFPKSDHIKETQLIKILKPLLDKITEDDIKIFNFGEGARSKLQFTQYPTVCQNNRQIFDTTGIFKTMSQVDSLAHKTGSDILQYIFVVRKNIKLSRRSIRFKEREKERNFRGQLHCLQQDVRDLCDHFNKGVISENALDKGLVDLIEDFEVEIEQKIAANIVDDLINSGEIEKSKGRLATRKARKFAAMYSELKQVK